MAETLEMGRDGKLFLQMEGEQLSFQMRYDGKVEVVEVDGEVEFVGDSDTPVDPKDIQVIKVAMYACKVNHVVFEHVIMGIKQHASKGTLYRLIITAKVHGVPKIFLTVILKMAKQMVVLLFKPALSST